MNDPANITIRGRGFRERPQFVHNMRLSVDSIHIRVDDTKNLEFWMEVNVPLDVLLKDPEIRKAIQLKMASPDQVSNQEREQDDDNKDQEDSGSGMEDVDD
jgi:hypothetical protein